MSRVVWITVLNKERDEAAAKAVHQLVSHYGLQPAGHFWRDELEKAAWTAAREDLARKDTGLWIVVGGAEDFAKPTVRYGLSMLAAGVQSQRGHGFPILLVPSSGELDPAALPTPLSGGIVVPLSTPTLGAKIAAKANLPVTPTPMEYRLEVYGIEGIGQWFEVGPGTGHEWNGVMFGVDGGEIMAHGVGPAQRLPERSVLEYPMKGLKLQLGSKEFTAWAVSNHLTDSDSYYLKVNDFPSSILFGPLSQEDDADAFIIRMK